MIKPIEQTVTKLRYVYVHIFPVAVRQYLKKKLQKK